MKLTVTEGTSLYESNAPYIIQKPLILQVSVPPKTGDFYYCYELNGKYKQVYIDNGKVEVRGLEAGVLHASVKHCVGDIVVREYPVEDLILKDLDGSIRATPEVEALREAYEAVQAALKKETRERQTLADEVETYKQQTREQMVALVGYAYAAYQGDIALNAKELPADEFARVVGMELTETEKATVVSQKEKF